jgi:hypothetical protein
VLISSLTHLADVGISAYIEDLCSSHAKLNRIFRGGLTVLPGIPIPPAAFTDPGLIRDLFILLDWSALSTSVVEGGEPVLVKVYRETKRVLMEAGTGTVQANGGVRYRFPTSLRCCAFQKWDTRGQAGLFDGVGPLAPSAVIRIVNSCLDELSETFGTPPLEMAGLYGAKSTPVPCRKKIILVGASHMRRMGNYLETSGMMVQHVETAHWRATTREVGKLMDEIKEAVAGANGDAAVVLGMTDNTWQELKMAVSSLTAVIWMGNITLMGIFSAPPWNHPGRCSYS